MAESGEAEAKSSPARAAEGLSQFVSKVLDQLSLTSWLPAAMLVGIGALLIQLHSEGNFDVPHAVAGLTSNAVGTIIVLLVAVVLAAVITQAFSFGTIRFFEGYWGNSYMPAWFVRRRTDTWSRRRKELDERIRRIRGAAFAEACQTMKSRGVADEFIDVLKDDFDNIPARRRRPHSDKTVADARTIDWQFFAGPADLNELDRSERRLEEFPYPHRLLPTLLGNLLRAREDKVGAQGDDLEGFVMRRYDNISSRLMAQHDRFRQRLDMYCTFVPVFFILAVSALGLLAQCGPYFIAASSSSVVLLGLSWLSYRAAIASARGYCSALKSIQEATQSANGSQDRN